MDTSERRPSAPPSTAPSEKKPRGFAAVDRTLLSEISRKGGKAAHAAGTAHEFTTAEAAIAGRKGGAASHRNRLRAQAQPQPVDPTEVDGDREGSTAR